MGLRARSSPRPYRAGWGLLRAEAIQRLSEDMGGHTAHTGSFIGSGLQRSPQLSPFPFQPPRGESRRPSARGSAGAERRGPYLLCRAPPGHPKLQRPREPAKAAPRWHGLLGAKRPPRSRGGYVALSQVAEDGRLSPSSGSDGELESRGSSGYSSAEVNQELSRQLLRDGYHLDEVPDDEDLDLIPPKPAAAPCPWCFGDSLCCVLQ
nr:protein FAM219B isoform X4 [Anas platyrhynchos]